MNPGPDPHASRPSVGPGVGSKTFDDDESVLQSHPLLPGIPIPCFGQTDQWPLHAARRPANVSPDRWVLQFHNLDGAVGGGRGWNLLVREVVMAMLNPQHPALARIGATLERAPYDPATLGGIVSEIRVLARWGTATRRPAAVGRWHADDLRAFITHLAVDRSPATVRNYVLLVRLLHKLAPALTGGGPSEDPWPGRSARTVANNRATGELTTRNIRPEVWFPLVKAAWTYVDVFGPDILRAHRRRRARRRGAGRARRRRPS